VTEDESDAIGFEGVTMVGLVVIGDGHCDVSVVCTEMDDSPDQSRDSAALCGDTACMVCKFASYSIILSCGHDIGRSTRNHVFSRCCHDINGEVFNPELKVTEAKRCIIVGGARVLTGLQQIKE
jgi:hypothetical protein